MASNEDQRSSYAWQKLFEAVYCLATSSADLRKRLAGAAMYLIRLKPEDFADKDARRKFKGIVDDLTFDEAGPDGSIEATTRQLSDHDAERIATRIFELFCALDARE